MKVEYTPRFARDLRKSIPPDAYPRVEVVILKLKAAANLMEVSNVEALAGRTGYFRLRVGDYQLGFQFSRQTAVLLRIAHRREIYRDFP